MNTQNESSGTICWKDEDIQLEQMGVSPLFEVIQLWMALELLMARALPFPIQGTEED